ncbi:MAG TPA: hypothetical protein VE288_05640 [Rubrobacteraceae bacterium]|nr:hypothetical protein [Rubrobacteraceae bacterium]
MSKHAASWLAWSMCVLSLTLTALSLLLLVLNLSHPDVPIYVHWVEDTLIALGFSTVGALILPRCPPENPIGWIFCAIALLFGVLHFTSEYAIYTLLAVPGSLPAGEVATWISFWLWAPSTGLIVFLLLLFPDGHLPSSRWRWFAWLSTVTVLVGTLWVAFSPGTIQRVAPLDNPLGIKSLPNVYQPVQALLFVLGLVAAASLFVRLRNAGVVERQQIKWFAYATAIAFSGAILTYSVSAAMSTNWLEGTGFVLLIVGVLGVPISMGIAILRYRLYEIDLIINRTLVYGMLTVSLALAYVGGVISLEYLFRLVTGHESNSAIVASTLAIAALFYPLRRRIQAFVDRHFYRRKYDAAKTLEALGFKLREETDLERICEDMVGMVNETMQPTHVSLWLCPGVSYSPKEQAQHDQQSTAHNS